MKAQATILLNRVSEAVPAVRWDRLTEGDGPILSVYGWIEQECFRCAGTGWIDDETGRPRSEETLAASGCQACTPPGGCGGTGVDRRADFILLRFEPYGPAPEQGLTVGFFTSSAELSGPMARAIWGELAEDIHVDCKRVEHELPGVEAAIKLPKAA